MIRQFPSTDPAFNEFQDFALRLHGDNPLWRKPRLPRREIDTGRFFLCTDSTGRTLARLYANPKFELSRNGLHPGIIGLYEAEENIPAEQVREFLESACDYLHRRGCNQVVGPMNGNTWFSYRFALPDENCSFFLDNNQPCHYPAQWLTAGFAPTEEYLSYTIERESFQCGRLDGFQRQLDRRGIRLQDIQPGDFETLLPEIHRLSMMAFADNPYYEPLPLEDFLALYRPLQPLLQPPWQVVARGPGGELLGFIFAIPDAFDPQHKSLVIKTVAVAPTAAARGIGAGLTVLLHHRARQVGYQRIYHALMHRGNNSTLINATGARVHRRYALFAKALVGKTLAEAGP